VLLLAIISLVILVVLATTLLGGWSRFVKHPEETATHEHEDDDLDTTSERFYRGVDRPAGPDAEDPPAP
jgi:hypothetical protein